jgi:hypothetical protein
VKEHTSMLVDGDIMGAIGCKKALWIEEIAWEVKSLDHKMEINIEIRRAKDLIVVKCWDFLKDKCLLFLRCYVLN